MYHSCIRPIPKDLSRLTAFSLIPCINLDIELLKGGNRYAASSLVLLGWPDGIGVYKLGKVHKSKSLQNDL